MAETRALRSPVPPALRDGAAEVLADAFAGAASAIGGGARPGARRLLMRVPVDAAARNGGLVVRGDRLDDAAGPGSGGPGSGGPDVLGAAAWVPASARGAGTLSSVRTGSWRLLPMLGPAGLVRVLRQAREADRLVGGFLHDDDAYLSVVGVRRDAHGGGHGRALVEGTVADAAAAGLARVVLLTHDPRNVPFYRCLGFDLVEDGLRSRGHPLAVLARAT